MRRSRQPVFPISRGKRGSDNDEGMTLIELLVAMGILTVVLVIFMAGVMAMVKTTVRSESATNANEQMRSVFQRMDREVRYSTAVNRPGIVNDKQYIEMRVQELGDKDAKCVQWRYLGSAQQLQRREWTDTSGAVPTSWITLVSKMRNNLSTANGRPFTFYPAGTDTASGVGYVNQRVRVHLDAGLGNAGDGRGSQIDTVLVARNSSDRSPSNADANNDGASDNPVCLSEVGRP